MITAAIIIGAIVWCLMPLAAHRRDVTSNIISFPGGHAGVNAR